VIFLLCAERDNGVGILRAHDGLSQKLTWGQGLSVSWLTDCMVYVVYGVRFDKSADFTFVF
jgi:hypothetical protein